MPKLREPEKQTDAKPEDTEPTVAVKIVANVTEGMRQTLPKPSAFYPKFIKARLLAMRQRKSARIKPSKS